MRTHLRFMIEKLVTTALLFLSIVLSWTESGFCQVGGPRKKTVRGVWVIQ